MLMIVLYEKGKIILHLKSHKRRLKMDTKLNGDDFISWKWYYFIESTILEIMQSQLLWKIVVIIRRFFTWYFYYYYDGWFWPKINRKR